MEPKPLAAFAFGASVLVLLAAAPPHSSAAQDEPSASEGWIPTPAEGDSNAKAFARVDNPSMYDIYLVSASSELSGAVEFRRAAENEPKSLREITVPAYGSVSLSADSMYLELLELTRPLEASETILITVTTDAGVEIPIRAVVKTE